MRELLRTKMDVFCFLATAKIEMLSAAQEAEDLGNTECVTDLRCIAEQIGQVTKRLASELEGKYEYT